MKKGSTTARKQKPGCPIQTAGFFVLQSAVPTLVGFKQGAGVFEEDASSSSTQIL
ncbi:hypothetical protein [Fictibacillus sp. S7]|uniref:hypothetical protein n=1 Tax=Fictibacillus sp. S7 TaxID=2212476 RepID=UPI0019D6BA31|nr:hypothetical protein [Fictibacillus sp. S7]